MVSFFTLEIKCCVVPQHLRWFIMEEHHVRSFFQETDYKTLTKHWWWQGMYTDAIAHRKSYPQCAIVNSSAGKVNCPPLHPIPVERMFQIAWSGHNGSPPNRQWQPSCCSVSRAFFKMTTCFSSTRSEDTQTNSRDDIQRYPKSIKCYQVTGDIPLSVSDTCLKFLS